MRNLWSVVSKIDSFDTNSLIRYNGRLALLLMATMIIGCTTTSPVKTTALKNFDPDRGYSLDNLEAGENNSDSLFVILTFSGGGTRAASFAYGVLESLRDTPIVWEGQERSLLDEVDVISSVSGGSLPSAYYGLFGDHIFEDFTEKALYANIQGSITKQFLSPNRWSRLMSPLYTRTDLLADGFDKKIFDQKTFADLEEKGTRPYVIINSTDISLGSRFGFTQLYFDLIYSDLSEFPVGHAVAASACFPGGFPPLSLKNQTHGTDYELLQGIQTVLESGDPGSLEYKRALGIQSYSDPDRAYIHLMDGGVADNLGLAPVIAAVRSMTHLGADLSGEMGINPKKVLIITVNSSANSAPTWDANKSPLGLIKTLLSASTTPMGNYSQALIAYLKLLIETADQKRELDPSIDIPEFEFIEVSFDYMKDLEIKKELNAIPTSFKLSRDKVDLLRSSAVTILKDHQGFQEYVADLK